MYFNQHQKAISFVFTYPHNINTWGVHNGFAQLSLILPATFSLLYQAMETRKTFSIN